MSFIKIANKIRIKLTETDIIKKTKEIHLSDCFIVRMV
jgi:hypothetical protein